MMSYDFVSEESSAFNRTYLTKLNEFFSGTDMKKIKFIPILAEPAVYFQKISNEKDLAALNITPRGKLEATIDFVQLHDNTKLAVYPSGKSIYLQVIDSLARMNNRRFFRIAAVKSAELSLANYIAVKKRFRPKENSLILYVGKDYSKLIFLKGERLFHVGATLSVGKNSFNAHNVIVSKILLEMEHGALSNIENIVICGEDESKDLVSIISEAYPRAKVSLQKLESVEIESKDAFSSQSSFIVPLAVAEEYYSELERKFTGINLLPAYIKEEQKPFQFGWQGYLLIALTALAAFYFSGTIVSNISEIEAKDQEIVQLLKIEAQNKETVSRIKSYESRIQNVDQIQSTLNQLSSGTGILSSQLKKLSDFTNYRRNIWMSELNMDANKNVKLSGFTFSRRAVRELSDSYKGATLKSITFEPLRDTRSFRFSIDAGNVLGGK
jgi:Tfp pilus assembly protein PilN